MTVHIWEIFYSANTKKRGPSFLTSKILALHIRANMGHLVEARSKAFWILVPFNQLS